MAQHQGFLFLFLPLGWPCCLGVLASVICKNLRPETKELLRSPYSSLHWALKVAFDGEGWPSAPLRSVMAHRSDDSLSGGAYLEES